MLASTARRSGYQAALESAGIAVDEELIRPGEFHHADGLREGRVLLSLPERPTTSPQSRMFTVLIPLSTVDNGKRASRGCGAGWSRLGRRHANPPWPAVAGGRHVSKPRLRQGRPPRGRNRPRGYMRPNAPRSPTPHWQC